MVFRCCVVDCYFNGSGKRLSSFPIKDKKLFKIWVQNINNPSMMLKTDEEIFRQYKICEKHFEPKWVQTGWYPGSTKPVLFKGAVPTLFLSNAEPVLDCSSPIREEQIPSTSMPTPKIQDKTTATKKDYIVEYEIPDEHAEISPTEDLTVQDASHEEHDLTVQKSSQDSPGCGDQMKKRTTCADQNTVEKDTRPPAKKVKTHEVLVDRDQEYCILNFITVFAAISLCVNCKECQKDVKFSKTDVLELGFRIALKCDCGERYINSCPQINNTFEINRRIVFAMRLLGVALNGLNLFCGIMDLGIGFASHIYYDCLEVIKTSAQAMYDLSTYSAIKEEIKLNDASKKPLRLCVSGDGTWEKRGFASVFGVTTLTGRNSRKIVDAVVKVNYCAECSAWSTKTNSLEYQEWYNSHKKICTVEFTNKINADSIKEMFQRSKIRNGVLYRTYVDQGNVKPFKSITDLDYCGYEIPVQKNVCVSHAERFMAAKLHSAQKIVSNAQNFTDELVDDLATSYGLAINGNPHSLEDMKRAVWADILHKISTNERPQHEYCPTGPESWCEWRQAEANGTLDTYEHEAPLDEEVVKVIWPIYENLSSDLLLTRCLGAYSWHSNPSLNAMIWTFAPKHLYASKATVDLATMLAVCIFNDGLGNILNIMQTMGITIGLHAAKLAEKQDVRSQRSDHAVRTAAWEGMLAQNDIYEVEEDPFYGLGVIH